MAVPALAPVLEDLWDAGRVPLAERRRLMEFAVGVRLQEPGVAVSTKRGSGDDILAEVDGKKNERGQEPLQSQKLAKGACPWATECVAFKQWVQDAVTQKGAAREELYAFLVECFRDADSDRDGFLNSEEFDFVVEKAAALPRRFGLAPSWKAMYGDISARHAGRLELFRQIDTGRKGIIGIDDWVQYAFKHISGKVRTMPMRTLDFQHLEASGKGHFL